MTILQKNTLRAFSISAILNLCDVVAGGGVKYGIYENLRDLLSFVG